MAKQGTYSYSLIRRILNTKIHSRVENLNSNDTNVERDLINSAVRIALSDIDFKGTICKTSLTPPLMTNQWDYVLPEGAENIIDLEPQQTDSRSLTEAYSYTTPEEFDRRKNYETGLYTIVSDNLTKTLRISGNTGIYAQELSTLEDTNWKSFDTISVNDSDVKVDEDDYTKGNGSIRFQTDTTDSTDSTVGIQNTSLTACDISTYLARGSAFVDAKLTTYDTGIHQLSIRVGSDSDNYYQISDSTQNDCSSFQSGWNKVRFDFANKTTTGTPSDTAIDYVALFWSRDTTTTALLHLNDTDWGFDNLQLVRGRNYKVSYYTKNAWQDTALATLENSTNDSHFLMLDNDEIEVVLAKASELASISLRDYEDARYYSNEYERKKEGYLMNNPSRSGLLITSRYEFNDVGDSYDS